MTREIRIGADRLYNRGIHIANMLGVTISHRMDWLYLRALQAYCRVLERQRKREVKTDE